MDSPGLTTELAPARSYLQTYLAPLRGLLARADVTDILVNRPGEAWVESSGGAFERHPIPGLDETALWRLVRLIAAFCDQGVSREHPLLSATLPDGARVQVIAPPATRGSVAIAIRKHQLADITLAELEARGAFARLAQPAACTTPDVRSELRALRDRGAVSEFLSAAVRHRQNIVVCGGTATGKTTVINALIKEIPKTERLVLIEDAAELRLDHPNAVGLIAVKGELGEARVSVDDLMQASLRMRPDRVIIGELRGREAVTFIRAANSGHPGSLTSVHADSPRGAMRQMALMMVQAGANLSRADCENYIRDVVDVWLQLSRIGSNREVSAIVFGSEIEESA